MFLEHVLIINLYQIVVLALGIVTTTTATTAMATTGMF